MNRKYISWFIGMTILGSVVFTVQHDSSMAILFGVYTLIGLFMMFSNHRTHQIAKAMGQVHREKISQMLNSFKDGQTEIK